MKLPPKYEKLSVLVYVPPEVSEKLNTVNEEIEMSVPSRSEPFRVNEFGPAVVLIQTFPKSANGETVVKSGLPGEARLTVTEYVLVVVPFCAVTTVVIRLSPTFNAIEDDGLPLATVTLFTLIVAVASAAVGVTVMELTLFATEDV